MWSLEQRVLCDIIDYKMSVGFYEQPKKWAASTIQTLPCGCNHVVSEYGVTLYDAVAKCLDALKHVKCNCPEE